MRQIVAEYDGDIQIRVTIGNCNDRIILSGRIISEHILLELEQTEPIF